LRVALVMRRQRRLSFFLRLGTVEARIARGNFGLLWDPDFLRP